jgi:uridylate kinase
MLNEYKYQRVLIKFSGESLSGQGETGYATDAIKSVVERVEKVIDSRG